MKTAVNFNKLSDRPALFQIPWKVYCYNNVISLFSEQKSSYVITNFAICYKSLQFDCCSKLRSRPTGFEAWQRMEEDVCHRGCVLYDIRITPLQRRLFTYITVSIQLKFSPTWNCVSLTRSTTSSEWNYSDLTKWGSTNFKSCWIIYI